MGCIDTVPGGLSPNPSRGAYHVMSARTLARYEGNQIQREKIKQIDNFEIRPLQL